MQHLEKGWAIWVIAAWMACGPWILVAHGDEFQVNTFTTGTQYNPAVAVHADGSFVVVWQDYSLVLDSRIQGQRFASDGSALGGEFQISTSPPESYTFPSVDMDADGDFVVAWKAYSENCPQDSRCIRARRLASDGSVLGDEIQVNTYTTGGLRDPSVAVAAEGAFVVVWGSDGSSGSDSEDGSVQGRRFASDGSALGGEFQVNTYTTGLQFDAAVASQPNGDFIVVWSSAESGGTDTSDFSIQAQRYASDGSSLGSEFQVNTYTTSPQIFPAVDVAPSGDFVVVWNSYQSAADGFLSVEGQRYSSDGNTGGDQFRINTYTTETQSFPAVSMDSVGDLVVVWGSLGSAGTDKSGYSVQSQLYTSNGFRSSGEIQLNTYTTNGQLHPSVGFDGDGNFVVAWWSNGSGGTDSDSASVQAGLFSKSLFTDGFETGDTSRWSSQTP